MQLLMLYAYNVIRTAYLYFIVYFFFLGGVGGGGSGIDRHLGMKTCKVTSTLTMPGRQHELKSSTERP